MDNDTLKEAKEAFKTASDAESEQRIVSLDDLKFAKLGEQWDPKDRNAREQDGRPCLTFNRIPSFLRQVTNDARQNRPAIKCHPVGDKADRETAEIYDGLIRNIEYSSDADVAYDTALDFAATMGFGYFIIRTDYATDDAFDLDLLIERVSNPFSIYADPFSTAADSSDWNDAFVTNVMKKDAFLRRWPKADQTDFKGDGFDSKEQPWFQGESIMVAEYWKRREVQARLLKLTDGSIMFEPEYLKAKELLDVQEITVDGDRMTKTQKCVQLIMNGSEVLETNDWRGKYIPIVPVYGDEVNVEGKRYFKSLFRDAKDAQRAYNYWRTISTELVALAPKAPYIGARGMFDSDPRWATANSVSHQNLTYDPVPGEPPPMRQPFTGPPAGALQESLNASDDMKNIMGIHDASLGARSNETSGRAIMARQREGDVATFHIIDNLSRGIRHAGRILVDLIPKHYDVPRIIRCIKEDGSNYPMPIKQPVAPKAQFEALQQRANAPMMPPGMQPPPQPMNPMGQMGQTEEQMGQQPPQGGPPEYVPIPKNFAQSLPPELQDQLKAITKVYDLAAGKYDVTVSAGPSFTTRREESAAQMMEFVRAHPQMVPLIGDLIAKNLDWPGADDIAKRLRAMLPPQAQGQGMAVVAQLKQMLQQQDAHAKQAVSVLSKQLEQLKQQLADRSQENAMKAEELRIKAFEAETKRAEAMKPDAVPQTQVDPLEVERVRLQATEVQIKAYDAETKRIDVEAKATEANVNAAALHMQQVAIPQANIDQNTDQMTAVIQALQGVAQGMAGMHQKPTRKQIEVVRDKAGKIVGASSVEMPIEPQIETGLPQ